MLSDKKKYNEKAVTLTRLAYRSRQFWQALFGPRTQVEVAEILPYLSLSQVVLFKRMQAAEQAHALRVFARLKAAGQNDRDLLVAALLHDVGKVLVPMTLLERVVIVLAKRISPRVLDSWGVGRPRGLRRPFVIAAQHAGWGADLAARAGASSGAVDLIRRHQDPTDPSPASRTGRLLAALQQADDAE